MLTVSWTAVFTPQKYTITHHPQSSRLDWAPVSWILPHLSCSLRVQTRSHEKENLSRRNTIIPDDTCLQGAQSKYDSFVTVYLKTHKGTQFFSNFLLNAWCIWDQLSLSVLQGSEFNLNFSWNICCDFLYIVLNYYLGDSQNRLKASVFVLLY